VLVVPYQTRVLGRGHYAATKTVADTHCITWKYNENRIIAQVEYDGVRDGVMEDFLKASSSSPRIAEGPRPQRVTNPHLRHRRLRFALRSS
jgi:hypothetical protein